MREAKTPEPLKIEQHRTSSFVDNCLKNVIGYVRKVSNDVITSLWRHQVGLYFTQFLRKWQLLRCNFNSKEALFDKIWPCTKLDSCLNISVKYLNLTINYSFIKIIAVKVSAVSKAYFLKVQNRGTFSGPGYTTWGAVKLSRTQC